MIDLAFAAFLATIGIGAGRRILDRVGETPEHPLDAAALSLPIGLGLLSLSVLALGALGWLNACGLCVLLAIMMELGLVPALRMLRSFARRGAGHLEPDRRESVVDRIIAGCLAIALLGTAMVAAGPVTDGDALCYHLQVPKVFLTRGATGFDPDLHETVYPLLTELLYAIALEFRGPVACRWIQWVLGLALAANVSAMARPCLGRRAWWAGAIVLMAPAISNGMSAPLNDVALAAFGTAAIFAWTRLLDQPSKRAAAVAGLCGGLAVGVKYPALVLVGLMGAFLWLAGVKELVLSRSSHRRTCWLTLAVVYSLAVIATGGWWYLRPFVDTGNPVYPFFRNWFGGAGLDEVLAPIKRPMAVTPWNLLLALGPLTLQPDRFDSFSHQLGPIFLLFLPAALLERPTRRVLGLAALGQLFLMVCLTQRQSMRFVLIALGPLSVAVAYGLSTWCDRRTLPARLMLAMLLGALGLEAGLAVARARHVAGLLAGRETPEALLSRREPTYVVGQWAARHLPASARLVGQDHRGFYIPRPYTMELAHRRRTGLGRHGEGARAIIDRLRASGFTHLMLCPPVPESAVEFDPTLGRLLDTWLAGRSPIYRADLTDGDGVLRRYAIYELADDVPPLMSRERQRVQRSPSPSPRLPETRTSVLASRPAGGPL
jgi:Dolichyl-phosphate-mannose-protein mannosyltransferase